MADTDTQTVTNDARDTGTQAIEGPALNADGLGHNHNPSPTPDGGLDGRMYAGNSNSPTNESDPKSVNNAAGQARSDAAQPKRARSTAKRSTTSKRSTTAKRTAAPKADTADKKPSILARTAAAVTGGAAGTTA